MSATQANSGTSRRHARLLTQNRELKQIGVWNWSLPAWAGRLPDGRTYNTCPSAGVCRWVCYARHGTYTWPVVRAKHQANLEFVLDFSGRGARGSASDLLRSIAAMSATCTARGRSSFLGANDVVWAALCSVGRTVRAGSLLANVVGW